MVTEPPYPDEPDEQASDAWRVQGSAGRSAIAAEEVDRASRTHWEATADEYQAEHGGFLSDPRGSELESDVPIDRPDHQRAEPPGFVWGPEGLTEAESGLLGPPALLAGRLVLEVGCGAAQCSRWLAGWGVQAVGIDISVNQLRHTQRAAPRIPVAAATATALPFATACFEAAFASYGATQFVADLPALFAEVHRVLRPGGRWVFSVTHPVRWAFPDDPGPNGLRATGSYFDRTPYVERDGTWAATYAEFHRTIGEYVAALVAAGFVLDTLVEPEWPAWNDSTWGGWSPLRGAHLPGTLILGCQAGARPAATDR